MKRSILVLAAVCALGAAGPAPRVLADDAPNPYAQACPSAPAAFKPGHGFTKRIVFYRRLGRIAGGWGFWYRQVFSVALPPDAPTDPPSMRGAVYDYRFAAVAGCVADMLGQLDAIPAKVSASDLQGLIDRLRQEQSTALAAGSVCLTDSMAPCLGPDQLPGYQDFVSSVTEALDTNGLGPVHAELYSPRQNAGLRRELRRCASLQRAAARRHRAAPACSGARAKGFPGYTPTGPRPFR